MDEQKIKLGNIIDWINNWSKNQNHWKKLKNLVRVTGVRGVIKDIFFRRNFLEVEKYLFSLFNFITLGIVAKSKKSKYYMN